MTLKVKVFISDASNSKSGLGPLGVSSLALYTQAIVCWCIRVGTLPNCLLFRSWKLELGQPPRDVFGALEFFVNIGT